MRSHLLVNLPNIQKVIASNEWRASLMMAYIVINGMTQASISAGSGNSMRWARP